MSATQEALAQPTGSHRQDAAKHCGPDDLVKWCVACLRNVITLKLRGRNAHACVPSSDDVLLCTFCAQHPGHVFNNAAGDATCRFVRIARPSRLTATR